MLHEFNNIYLEYAQNVQYQFPNILVHYNADNAVNRINKSQYKVCSPFQKSYQRDKID